MVRAGLLLLLACLSACASVQPWEKEVLSQPRMQFRDSQGARPFLNHALITTEQAEGGDGQAGGGCGCR